MIIVNTDLDNTVIYSYKHDLGSQKRNVEIYQGREISFVSETTFALLQKVKEACLLVPTTTRSIEQYRRIDLGVGDFPYALVCNGGILLEQGAINEAWYAESLHIIQPSQKAVEQAIELLEKEPRRYFEVRHIESLFVFTKCYEPEQVVKDLAEKLDADLVDVFHNGDKVYVVPKALNKGMAVNRLKKRLDAKKVIAAGDSEFDISMVESADLGIVPKGFKDRFGVSQASVREAEGKSLFSEEALAMCLQGMQEK